MSIEDDIRVVRRSGNAWFNNVELLALERLIEAAQVAEKETGTVWAEEAGTNGPVWRKFGAVLSFSAPFRIGQPPVTHYVIGRDLNGHGTAHYVVRTEAQMKTSNPAEKVDKSAA